MVGKGTLQYIYKGDVGMELSKALLGKHLSLVEKSLHWALAGLKQGKPKPNFSSRIKFLPHNSQIH